MSLWKQYTEHCVRVTSEQNESIPITGCHMSETKHLLNHAVCFVCWSWRLWSFCLKQEKSEIPILATNIPFFHSLMNSEWTFRFLPHSDFQSCLADNEYYVEIKHTVLFVQVTRFSLLRNEVGISCSFICAFDIMLFVPWFGMRKGSGNGKQFPESCLQSSLSFKTAFATTTLLLVAGSWVGHDSSSRWSERSSCGDEMREAVIKQGILFVCSSRSKFQFWVVQQKTGSSPALLIWSILLSLFSISTGFRACVSGFWS